MSLDSLLGLEPATGVIDRKLFINNTELTDEVFVSHISVNKSFNKIASAKLIFQDGSVSKANFYLSNDQQFKPGNKIKIQLGPVGGLETVFEGIIVKHGIKLKRSGVSILVIEAKDEAVKLSTTRKSANYFKKKDSTVIKEILGKLAGKFDDTIVEHPQLVQFESTNWDFIVTRAEANGLLISNDDGEVTLVKPSIVADPVMTALYGDNILEFEADMDARRQFKKVTGLTWNFTKQDIEESKNASSSFKETGDLNSSQLADVLGAEITLSHSGHLEQKQAQAWAEAYALRSKLSKAIGRVRVKGNAKVKPGSTITLEGVGDHFNGDVYVTGILHQFDGSWYTDIQFGWNEEWFYHKEKVMEKPAAGLLPAVNGLQIGIVQEVNDSEGQFRVKVYLATMGKKTTGIWARIAQPDAGVEHGVVFRPQKDDEVVLGFLNDDPRDAIILGYLHSKGNLKSPLSADEKDLEYGVVTKKKQKLVFNESKKKITITAPADSGDKTIILNDSDAVVLKDGFDNLIKMEKSGITIKSKGQVIINGKTVRIN